VRFTMVSEPFIWIDVKSSAPEQGAKERAHMTVKEQSKRLNTGSLLICGT
jgi:hypothetical protein